ncbi:uncharacterized protein LOC141590125 [Silene latifolia]|uniref:uncharacterized protein LOC141590125 n=1 Tax=Silene latifolia TaxID=37657 RepID=UPI003D76C8AD
MGKYMVYKGLDKGKKVEGFPFVNITFNWQGAGYTVNDCGLYVMVHMLLYRGEPFECTIGTKDSNDLMRAEVVATLVLSDINVDREAVLSRVAAFKEVKDREMEELREAQRLAGNTSGRKRGAGVAGENSSAKRPCSKVSSTYQTPPPQVALGRTPSSRALSAVNCRSRGKGDGLGCTTYCGEPDADLTVVAKVLRLNKALIRDIPVYRKQVADYVFLDDYKFPNGELLVNYSRHATINRLQMLSTLPETPMDDSVIECEPHE